MAALLRNVAARLTPSNSSTNIHGFQTAKQDQLFPKTDPAVDGEECLHDCDSCSVRLPRGWKIDEDDKLYGHVNEWSTHLIVATGKTDWVRSVEDEKGSVMEAVGNSKVQPTNGKMMLSASNMPLPHHHSTGHEDGTTVLLLPSFQYIDNVTPALVPELIEHCVSKAPTNTSPLPLNLGSAAGLSVPESEASQIPAQLSSAIPERFTVRDCPHAYLILLCSQGTRDARCGQSAPLLRKEFERHLRPLGLHRDLDDERPGGVGIYFISHVGGHKYSANCMIYRRGSKDRESTDATGVPRDQAAQCIWLARVRPEDCENLIRFTILQGKLVKPESQLRGGFDRSRRLTSW